VGEALAVLVAEAAGRLGAVLEDDGWLEGQKGDSGPPVGKRMFAAGMLAQSLPPTFGVGAELLGGLVQPAGDRLEAFPGEISCAQGSSALGEGSANGPFDELGPLARRDQGVEGGPGRCGQRGAVGLDGLAVAPRRRGCLLSG